MEKELDSVEEGTIEWVRIIDSFYQDFAKRVEKAEAEMQEVEIEPEYAGVDCEECGHPMVYKMGRYGKFMACSNFPDCRNTKPIVKDIGVKCPSCHEGNIVERKSKKRRIFTAVIVFQSVNSSLGTNQLKESVQNAKICL